MVQGSQIYVIIHEHSTVMKVKI